MTKSNVVRFVPFEKGADKRENEMNLFLSAAFKLSRKTGICWASIPTLATESALSIEKTRAAKKLALERGLIRYADTRSKRTQTSFIITISKSEFERKTESRRVLPIPEKLLKAEILTPQIKLFWGYLFLLSMKKGFCFAKQRTLADAFTVKKLAINRWSKELKKYGLINIRHRKGEHSYYYILENEEFLGSIDFHKILKKFLEIKSNSQKKPAQNQKIFCQKREAKKTENHYSENPQSSLNKLFLVFSLSEFKLRFDYTQYTSELHNSNQIILIPKQKKPEEPIRVSEELTSTKSENTKTNETSANCEDCSENKTDEQDSETEESLGSMPFKEQIEFRNEMRKQAEEMIRKHIEEKKKKAKKHNLKKSIEWFIQLWNKNVNPLTKIKPIKKPDVRVLHAISLILSVFIPQDIETVIKEKIPQSDYLSGRSAASEKLKQGAVDIFWLSKPMNFIKVFEGYYDSYENPQDLKFEYGKTIYYLHPPKQPNHPIAFFETLEKAKSHPQFRTDKVIFNATEKDLIQAIDPSSELYVKAYQKLNEIYVEPAEKPQVSHQQREIDRILRGEA